VKLHGIVLRSNDEAGDSPGCFRLRTVRRPQSAHHDVEGFLGSKKVGGINTTTLVAKHRLRLLIRAINLVELVSGTKRVRLQCRNMMANTRVANDWPGLFKQ
jgi:hypothetical protein